MKKKSTDQINEQKSSEEQREKIVLMRKKYEEKMVEMNGQMDDIIDDIEKRETKQQKISAKDIEKKLTSLKNTTKKLRKEFDKEMNGINDDIFDLMEEEEELTEEKEIEIRKRRKSDDSGYMTKRTFSVNLEKK